MLSAHRALSASAFACLFLFAYPQPTVCAPGRDASMKPDQINTQGWDKGWTNLVNDVEQAFKPSLHLLTAVEVELVVGNPGPATDELTLTVLDSTGNPIAEITQTVPTQNSDQVLFVIPKGGVELTPGNTYRLKLTGGTTFGWKYIAGGYKSGSATFNGKPLLPDARSSFLFRTFGTN